MSLRAYPWFMYLLTWLFAAFFIAAAMWLRAYTLLLALLGPAIVIVPLSIELHREITAWRRERQRASRPRYTIVMGGTRTPHRKHRARRGMPSASTSTTPAPSKKQLLEEFGITHSDIRTWRERMAAEANASAKTLIPHHVSNHTRSKHTALHELLQYVQSGECVTITGQTHIGRLRGKNVAREAEKLAHRLGVCIDVKYGDEDAIICSCA